MSVYKRPNQPSYSYDFVVQGHRFTGNTETANRTDAKKIEKTVKEKAKAEIASDLALGSGPMTLEQATGRYWTEIGQHHVGADTTLRDIIRLQDFFGKNTLLVAIDDNAVAVATALRRAQTVNGLQHIRDPANPKLTLPAPLITPSTVNRSLIEPLQKICNRARKVWKVALPNEPAWKEHLLKEPKECVREVKDSEEKALENAIRPDYLPLVNFARASGLRLTECLMRKDQVDLKGGYVHVTGKGNVPIAQPITSEMRRILMAAIATPTDHVFTYVAARTRKGEGGWLKGERLPITASGLKTMWRRARINKSGNHLPVDLRFHDMRHDFATKLLRETGNLKLVQKALHHQSVTTTVKYAHVHDAEVAAGMEQAAKSREKSRKASRKAAK